MTDPTEDIPADSPFGECNGDLKLGALDPGVSGAVGIGAVVESAEQLDRPLKGMEAPVSVVTDVHHPSAARALAFDDVELPQGEVGILGPSVGHRAVSPDTRLGREIPTRSLAVTCPYVTLSR